MKHSAAEDSYDVFLSYRRDISAAEARLIREDLTQRGLRVFMDVTDLSRGLFDEALMGRIGRTRNFVVILSPHGLDRAGAKGDWLHKEIAQAMLAHCNIVPVMLPNFAWPKELPEDIRDLQRYQAVEYSHVFFDATMDRLAGMLQDVPERAAHKAERDRISVPKWVWWVTAGVAAVMAAVAVPAIRYEAQHSRDQKLSLAIRDLRLRYRGAVNASPAARSADLAAAQNDVDTILGIDPQNGTGLYYSSEIKRMGEPSLFAGSCAIPEALKNYQGTLDAYEEGFYHYLDVESGLPRDQTGGGNSAELCYARVSGYCTQRTAWIDHVLANDLYEEGLQNKDPAARSYKLKLALGYARRAAGMYQDAEHNPGFSQCVGTETLISAIPPLLEQGGK